jgi:hypothetical protein
MFALYFDGIWTEPQEMVRWLVVLLTLQMHAYRIR